MQRITFGLQDFYTHAKVQQVEDPHGLAAAVNASVHPAAEHCTAASARWLAAEGGTSPVVPARALSQAAPLEPSTMEGAAPSGTSLLRSMWQEVLVLGAGEPEPLLSWSRSWLQSALASGAQLKGATVYLFWWDGRVWSEQMEGAWHAAQIIGVNEADGTVKVGRQSWLGGGLSINGRAPLQTDTVTCYLSIRAWMAGGS